ncbi:MAG TPA: potassium channel family protein [Gaiellaceae bacterium]|nr:potassium channel family protein [Gaiellaceae bacterium]
MVFRRRLTLVQAFGLAAVVTGTGVLVGGWLISTLEPERFEHVGEGVWWAITTITTVGYGDFVPSTAAGRAVGAGLMLLGFAALAFVTATMASIIVGEVRAEERLIEREETEILALLSELNERLERLERTVAGEAEGPVSPAPRGRGARAAPR